MRGRPFHTWILTISLLLAAVLFVALPAGADNDISNPGFETRVGTDDKDAASWTESVSPGSNIAERSIAAPIRTGIASAKTDSGKAQEAFFYINPTVKTPGTTGAWVDIDVSGDIPAGSTGVILRVKATQNQPFGLRMNGSTDNRIQQTNNPSYFWAMIGVDSNRTFQAYIGSTTTQTIWLVGYTLSGVTFFTNAVDKSLGTFTSWVDIDISGDIGSDTAVGAIIEMTSTKDNKVWGVRMKGSADERLFLANRHRWAVIGVDADEVLQGNIQGKEVDFFLVGYITNGATFFTNGVDKSLATIDSWIDIDVSADTGSDTANGVFMEVVTTANQAYGLRKNGDTESEVNAEARHAWGIVEVDVSEILEGQIADVGVDFFLIGYSLSNVSASAQFKQALAYQVAVSNYDSAGSLSVWKNDTGNGGTSAPAWYEVIIGLNSDSKKLHYRWRADGSTLPSDTATDFYIDNGTDRNVGAWVEVNRNLFTDWNATKGMPSTDEVSSISLYNAGTVDTGQVVYWDDVDLTSTSVPAPVISNLRLEDSAGQSKVGAQLDVDVQYFFLLNVTDDNGW